MNRLIGLGEEVGLPTMEQKTTTVTGAGMLGEFEDPVIGQFKSMETELAFRTLYVDMFSLMRINAPLSLTLRGSMQNMDSESGISGNTPIRVVMKGKFKSFEAGKAKIGEGTDSKLKIELWYELIEVNGKTGIEIDKLNARYIVDGVDQLADINKYC